MNGVFGYVFSGRLGKGGCWRLPLAFACEAPLGREWSASSPWGEGAGGKMGGRMEAVLLCAAPSSVK